MAYPAPWAETRRARTGWGGSICSAEIPLHRDKPGGSVFH